MEFYAIFIPDKKPDFSIKSFYNDKTEALSVLKQHKEARMKAFASSEEAVSFYLNGPSETYPKSTTPAISSPIKPPKSPFSTPTSQKLVAFRKLIEANNVSEVYATIQNPRYLVSSGDTPTILKEGPRYNALHIAAIEGRGEICKLILRTIADSSYIEKLHGLRTISTEEVSAILLDLYLNTPDKCRRETPLHFAAKHGSVDVINELIAYPQCQVVPNGDGLLPRDIICSRAKPAKAGPEVREAIRVLLDEHFFVPLVRYEDNLIPPTIGKPFSPTRPISLEEPGSPTISPRGEVKAYAGPMDRSKADSFYRRWKTPPRLVVVSPRMMRSEEPRLCSSSTPIKAGRLPRRLFANRSLDHALLEGARSAEARQENNNIDESGDEFSETDGTIDNSILMDAIEEDQMRDSNGNPLSPVVSTPIRLFHQYRNLANDMDSSIESEASCGEANFSYLCDETRMVYDRSRLRETPTHKERTMRLSNIDKGLETLGRMLASNENVGWKEHWAFLGKFCDLASEEGLRMFEEFLVERKNAIVPEQVTDQDEQSHAQSKDSLNEEKIRSLSEEPLGANNSINMLCDNMQRFKIGESGTKVGLVVGDSAQPREVSSQRQLANPYLCVTSSLKVLATRFLMNLQNKGLQEGKKNTGGQNSPFLHVVQMLDTMVENFRADAAFREIDFDKAHALFTYLVLALMGERTEHKALRFAPLNTNDVGQQSGPASGDVASSYLCIKFALMYTMYDRFPAHVNLTDETESECRRLWQEESLITACDCRPQIGISVARRKKERMKRREERTRQLSDHGDAPMVVVDYKTYRSTQPAPSPPITPPSNDPRSTKSLPSDDDDVYLSCSDTDEERDAQGDDDDVFFTPPSSPTSRANFNGFFPCDTNNNAERMESDEEQIYDNGPAAVAGQRECPKVFIAGTIPTKQDFDVWTALESVEIDGTQYPHVHAWKDVMREHIGSKYPGNEESKDAS
uniref:ANKLE2 third alpha/beta domain-containing protein n=1 Tax=Anopheles atroparvus TaxID=41427 RepID=A0AAG5D4Y7_ANOAO